MWWWKESVMSVFGVVQVDISAVNNISHIMSVPLSENEGEA